MDVTTSSLPPDVDRRHSYVVLIVTCLVLENVFVLSRLYIRTVVRRALGWDDYLICLALAFHVLNATFFALSLRHGLMKHVYYLSPDQLAETTRWLKASEAVSVIVPVLIKLSVSVSFVKLIDLIHPTTRLIMWIMMAVLTISGLVTFLVIIMQCVPLDKLWYPTKPGKCISIEAETRVFFAYGIICTLTDFMCAVIPTLILYKVQMDKLTKVALCSLLGLALIPGICSIFKTMEVLSMNDPDITWASSGVSLWILLEMASGFIVSCLPMLWSPTVSAVKAASSRLSSRRNAVDSPDKEQTDHGHPRLAKPGIYRRPAPELTSHDHRVHQPPLFADSSSPGRLCSCDGVEHLHDHEETNGTIYRTHINIYTPLSARGGQDEESTVRKRSLGPNIP